MTKAEVTALSETWIKDHSLFAAKVVRVTAVYSPELFRSRRS